MKLWISKMLSEKDGMPSSKRFTAVLIVVVLLFVFVFTRFSHYDPAPALIHMFDSLLTFAALLFGLNVTNNIFAGKKNDQAPPPAP